MLSSAGSNNPELRSRLVLVAVALAALAASLLLAFASAMMSRPDANAGNRATAESHFSPQVRQTPAQTPVAARAAQPPAVPAASGAQAAPLLWTVLAPWAVAVDAIAVLGLAAVLIVRRSARRRRGARR